ncbi:CU044_2847 family protein [Streptomyces sp. NK15101]|uniref:CU044_2847 family protein n=1 Tax=Streptomyces sp. NK15101 TaxID=2873261 RepID=UPI001CED3F94|nr:CU044_2847 family protein [Streptomyces sp. NK15101]
MPDVTKVEVGDATLFVEARRLGPEPDPEGPDPGLEGLGGRLPDLSGVTEALSAFAGRIGESLHQAAPDRATVEFGCQLGLDAGRLTALVVQGGANASLRVTLEWTKAPG